MNNKEQFRSWVLTNMGENSNAGSSYIISLDWLSNRFFETGKISKKFIFEIEDIDLISKLYDEVKGIQRDKSSYIFNKDAPSYGMNGFYSASLKKYMEFLTTEINDIQTKISSKKSEDKIEVFNTLSLKENVLKSGLVHCNV